jgi:hypothetical protein
LVSFEQERCYSSHDQLQVKERISTYGIERLTFDSYQEQCATLGYFNALAPLRITLNPHDQVCSLGKGNAYYQRTGTAGGRGVIEFYSHNLPTARIFDIVAHETGHAILDTLRPDFYGHPATHPYSALHESFGDLSALFASIKLAKLTNRTNQETICSFLKGRSFCLAPDFSADGACLRNPARYNGTSCEAHDHSNYLTNFVINSMRGTFGQLEETEFNAGWTSDFFQQLLIYTVIKRKQFNSLGAFSQLMINNVENLLNQDEDDLHQLITGVMRNEYNRSPLSMNTCAINISRSHRAQSRYAA